MEVMLLYAVAGVFVGLMAGLFGIGGGVIIVPVLLFAFASLGISDDVAMHLAVGSSLATIILTSLSSVRAHWRYGNVIRAVLMPYASGLVIGALVGAQVAGVLSGRTLSVVFAAFVLLMALRMIVGGQPRTSRQIPGNAGLAGVGAVVGAASSLVGIGGGSLTVPFLRWCGADMRRAVGTSAAAGLPIAVAGTIGFIIAGGVHAEGLPAGSTGFIYWPAVIGIAIPSVLLAPVGARIASRVPQKMLTRAFAVLLIAVAVRMLMT